MSLVTRCVSRAVAALASATRLPVRVNFNVRGALPGVPCSKAFLHASRVSRMTGDEKETDYSFLKSRTIVFSGAALPQPPKISREELRRDFLQLQAAVENLSLVDCEKAEEMFARLEGVPLKSVSYARELEKFTDSLIAAGRKFYKEGPIEGVAEAYFLLSNAWELLKNKNDFLLGHQLFALSLFDVTRIKAHSKFIFALLEHPDFSKASPVVQAALYSDAALCYIILSGPLPDKEKSEHLALAVAYYGKAAKLDTPFIEFYVHSRKGATSLADNLPPFMNLGFVNEAARAKTFVLNFRPSYLVQDGGPISLYLWSLVDMASPRGQSFMLSE